MFYKKVYLFVKYIFIPRYFIYKFSKKYKILDKIQLDKDSIVIDFGAHVGEVSDYFLRKNCKVFAYEPCLSSFKNLKKLKKNKNFTCFNIGISNIKETKYLYNKFANRISFLSQGSSIFKSKYKNSQNFEKCNFDTLDNILKSFDHINLIKIDIEGSEYLIIDDLLKNVDKFDLCLIETHDKYDFFNEMHLNFMNKINTSKHKHKFNLNWF